MRLICAIALVPLTDKAHLSPPSRHRCEKPGEFYSICRPWHTRRKTNFVLHVIEEEIL